MDVTICDLPPEVLLVIFKHLTIQEMENISLTCVKFKKFVAEFYFGPRLKSFSRLDDDFRFKLIDSNWTEDCDNIDLIMRLHKKFKPHKSKFLKFII